MNAHKELLKLADDIQETYRYQGGQVFAEDLRLIARQLGEVLKALQDFIEDSPIGDDDKHYCSDVMGTEFRRLVSAWEAMKAAKP